MAKRDQGTLALDLPSPRQAGPGPVYQGVCKEIRAREEADESIRQTMAGTIAQARSLAASIDRESGHVPGSRQASGMQLAALHAQLDALLVRLAPEGSDGDPWEELQKQLQEAETHGRPAAPHPPE